MKRVAEGQTVTRQAVLDLVTSYQVSWTMAVIRLGALRPVSEEERRALSDVSPRQLAFAANRGDWWQAAES